ncbi:hypothetical protein OQA88_4543 [Cercophora sp. LCS_1]
MARIECTECGANDCSSRCFEMHEEDFGCHDTACRLHLDDVLRYNDKLYPLSEKVNILGRERGGEYRQGRTRYISPSPGYERERPGGRERSPSPDDQQEQSRGPSPDYGWHEQQQYRSPSPEYERDEPRYYRSPSPDVHRSGQGDDIDFERLRSRFDIYARGRRQSQQPQEEGYARPHCAHHQYSRQQHAPHYYQCSPYAQYPQHPQYPYGPAPDQHFTHGGGFLFPLLPQPKQQRLASTMDSHEDTTTTDYDSGDSEGIGFAYKGKSANVTVTSKQVTKAASPKRTVKSRSPKGKSRCSGHCHCVCGTSQSSSQSDDNVSTEFEEDTDVEGNVENRCLPPRRRLSGPEGTGAHEEQESGHHSNNNNKKKASARRAARKRTTPYIEEYPEETWRPVILLKEHKVPRRFSTSDAKQSAQGSVEDHQDAGSAARGRSPTGKRLPAWVTHSGGHPLKKQSSKQRHENQDKPGDQFSSSDLGKSGSEREHRASHVKALEPSPPRRHSRESHPPMDVAPGVTRSSTWPHQQPQYSAPRSLQKGSPPPADQTRGEHGYESEDESDRAPPLRQQHTIERHHAQEEVVHTIQTIPEPHRHHQQHPRHQQQRANPSPRRSHTLPHVHTRIHVQVPPEPQPQRRPEPSQPVTREPRPRARPPRPIVARTIVSQRSMAGLDQGYRRGASPAATLCEIWRGRPEDWESPYSSSDEDGYGSGLDGERIPGLMLLEGSPRRRDPSVAASLFSRRSRDTRHESGFLRRPDLAAPVAAWERCASPERMDDEVLEVVLETGRQRAPSRARSTRSRWTMMEYRGGAEEPEGPEMELPPSRRWTYDVTLVGREKEPEPVFSARKTREFLSPKPKRAATFDFDAWGTKGSRSMLALGLGLA